MNIIFVFGSNLAGYHDAVQSSYQRLKLGSYLPNNRFWGTR